jgi:DNA topoisomerase-3
MGKPFAAVIKLNDEFRTEFDFGQSNADDQTPVDFSGQDALGKCPKCDNQVFEMPMAFVCEKSVGEARACDFRSGKIILQRNMEREQMLKLLATGKTDLLHRFISKKGRPFSAYLVRKPDGSVGFEFEVREKKAAGSARKTKVAAKSS